MEALHRSEVISLFLYLVQHGEAKNEKEDPSRGLTEKGTSDVVRVARFLEGGQLPLGRIFHSNKTRAEQTALIFAHHLKPAKGVSQSDDLAPNDDPEVWARRIANTKDDIMLVGHLPFLPKLANLLLCSEKKQTLIDFKMAGVVCLARSDDGRWAVAWMIVPELLG